MPKAVVNPRKAAVDKISTKIATFLVAETYRDEQAAQKLLSEAVGKLDAAVLLLVAADEKAAGQPEHP